MLRNFTSLRHHRPFRAGASSSMRTTHRKPQDQGRAGRELRPIVCVGETLPERESDRWKNVLETQLRAKAWPAR